MSAIFFNLIYPYRLNLNSYIIKLFNNNAQQGASDIIFGNGEPPDEKNPSHRPGLCKHLIHLREYVKKKHGI